MLIIRRAVFAGYVSVCLLAVSAMAAGQDAERPGRLAERLEITLDKLGSQPVVAGRQLRETGSLKSLYSGLDGRLIWVDVNGLTSSGRDLIDILQATTYEGLDPAAYHVDTLAALQQQIILEADAAVAEVLAVRAARVAEMAAELAAIRAAQEEAEAAAQLAESLEQDAVDSDDDDEDVDDDDYAESDDDEDVDDDDEASSDDDEDVDDDADESDGDGQRASQASDDMAAALSDQEQLPPPVAPPPRLDLLVDMELLLTDGYLRLARHRAEGVVDPANLNIGWHIAPRKLDFSKGAEKAAERGNARAYLQSLKPAATEYLALETALQRYSALADKEAWKTIGSGQMLKLNMSDSRLAAIRARLRLTGDLEAGDAADDSDVVDMNLHRAIQHFQARHGLKSDGVVGPKTLYMLNIPVAEKLQALRVNLERWRWIPHDLGSTHIRVNVAGFHMAVYENNQPVLDMPVIVGQPDRRTPNFSETMKYLVANPTWEVPPSIAKKDKLPILRENLAYLTEHGFDVLQGWGENEVKIDAATLDWNDFNDKYFPYRLRQNPGPTNALGRIKFMLPNKYNIYLHDTPGKHLFTAETRTFSSGCIRLERPLDLADYILGQDERWLGKDIREILEGEPKQILRLKKHIPVHILYFTAWVDEQGVVNYREDVYNRDAEVLDALHQKAVSGQ